MELARALQVRAERIKAELRTNDFAGIQELIVMAHALSSTTLLEDALSSLNPNSQHLSVSSRLAGVRMIMSTLEDLQYYGEEERLRPAMSSLARTLIPSVPPLESRINRLKNTRTR
jgi:hypothetical protein